MRQHIVLLLKKSHFLFLIINFKTNNIVGLDYFENEASKISYLNFKIIQNSYIEIN